MSDKIIEEMKSSTDIYGALLIDYNAIKNKAFFKLIFEGKECPLFYKSKIKDFCGKDFYDKFVGSNHLIGYSKKNIIRLHTYISNHSKESDGKALFFIDKDYDDNEFSKDIKNIYITPGYSFESEFFSWDVMSDFIVGSFGLSGAYAQDILSYYKTIFDSMRNKYIQSAKELHSILYVCHRLNILGNEIIKCKFPDKIDKIFVIDWDSGKISPKYTKMDELYEELTIPFVHIDKISKSSDIFQNFNQLNPDSDWYGKLNFSFLKNFLTYVFKCAKDGKTPFEKKSKPVVATEINDSLIRTLSPYVNLSPNLQSFLERELVKN